MRRPPPDADRARLLAALPDEPKVASCYDLLPELGLPAAPNVLDVGCGTGVSRAHFLDLDPSAAWHAVDIADSPEGLGHQAAIENFRVFDGVHIPHDERSFDAVFSNQVLEHVRHPDALVAEVYRVLRPGGVYVGQVSYLEPYHSRSIFNFTPYGCLEVLEDAGFTKVTLWPARDGATMLVRSMSGALKRRARWLFRSSPLFSVVDAVGTVIRASPRQRALQKLLVSGCITFVARRPASEAPRTPPPSGRAADVERSPSPHGAAASIARGMNGRSVAKRSARASRRHSAGASTPSATNLPLVVDESES